MEQAQHPQPRQRGAQRHARSVRVPEHHLLANIGGAIGRSAHHDREQPAITDTLRGELQAAFATQKSRLSEEIGDAMAKMNKRIEAVEKGVTKQLQQTLVSIQDLAVKQEKQAVTLVQTGAETKQLVNRVLALEEQVAQLKRQPAASRSNGEPSRRPAFIVGGWDGNQEAKVTLEKATTVLKELQVDVDMDDAFVPGLRRGYVIVPMTTRQHETFDEMRGRVQQAVVRVRTANVTLGNRDDGTPSRLWMAVSQPPDRRKREMNGDIQHLDVEWATGSVWYRESKVASARGTKPDGAQDAGPGWINLPEIAKQAATGMWPMCGGP